MKFPPPGRMINIAGRQFHLHRSGPDRGPTVVLEAGLAATSLSWATVQPLIAQFGCVASYDRAGLGWSGDAATPATALNAARDLHLLLSHAELPEPYILVGHSLGGLIVRIFQQQHPEQVAGLVLVDPVDRAEWSDPTKRRMLARGAALSRRGAFLARLGIVRFALGRLTEGSGRTPRVLPQLIARVFAGNASGVASRLVGEVRKIPRELWPVVAANWSEERAFRTMAGYLDNLPLSVSQLDEERSLGDLPVVVLSSGNASPGALAGHEHDARLSVNGEHLVVPGAGHWINFDAPEVIATAVERVWQNIYKKS